MSGQPTQSPIVLKALAVREQISARFHSGQLAYDRDMRNLTHELEIMHRLGETFVVGRLFTLMGIIEFQRGHFIAAYDYTLSALFCYEEVEVQRQIISSLNYLGEIHQQWGRHEEALNYYTQARAMAEHEEAWDLIPLILNNIGLLYAEDNHPQKALPLLEESLQYARRAGGRSGSESETHNAIARAYLALGDFTAAWEAARRALETSERQNRVYNMGMAYRTLGTIAAATDQPDKDPAHFFRQSRELFRVNGAQLEYARTLVVEARWWLANGQRNPARNNLATAQAIFVDLKLADETEEVRRLLDQTGQLGGGDGQP